MFNDDITLIKPKATITVLGRVKEGLLKRAIVKFQVEKEVTFADYGIHNPEGWEYDIDPEGELYNPRGYDNEYLFNISIIRAEGEVPVIKVSHLVMDEIFDYTVTCVEWFKE